MTATKDESKAVKARIADLNVLMHCKTQFMVQRLQKYLYDFDTEAQVEIDITEQQLTAYVERYPNLDYDVAEYMLSGTCFYIALYRSYQGMMIHASAIAMDGQGYLFSANSGTGKSTHTDFWKKNFGAHVQFINDDKPALRLMEQGWCVYGTPWSGKTDLNNNISVPLKSIAFLYRSEENKIARIDSLQAVPLLLEQTIRPKNMQGMEQVLSLLDKLLERIPIYHLGCNMSIDAAQLAYDTMKQ